MRETTTCDVTNTVDDKPMTIITEWTDEELKIIVIGSESTSLIAETTITEMYGCMKRKKTREEFMHEMKTDLSGETEGLKFALRATRLTWKMGMWMRGTITMKHVDNISPSESKNIEWIKKYSSLRKTTAIMEKENEILKKKTEDLISTINEMEKIKKSMEDSLYKQFILLLNSKKRKIRELEEKLKDNNRTLYDENTDVSDDNVEKSCISKKRAKPNESSSPLASTSTNLIGSQRKYHSESDDDIELRYVESQT